MLLTTFCVLGLAVPSGGERLDFAVADGTRLLKKLRVTHELQLTDMGSSWDDGPLVPDGTGGWISAWFHVDLLDEYLKSEPRRPLELRRTIAAVAAESKATVTRLGGQKLEEEARQSSPLRGQTVLFTWVEGEGDWSRCFDRLDGDEEWLAGLRGEFDLLALLPGREVAEGERWEIDPTRLREVFAPSGDLLTTPTTTNLFGRVMEMGVAGDYADFLGPDCAGTVTGTFQGVREVALAPDEAGGGAASLRVGVIALELNIALVVDRTRLYVAAMPMGERREPARVDSVPLEYTLVGQGELLWDLDGGHFHSLSITGRESYGLQLTKTQFAGKDQHRISQHSRYSGTLGFELTATDGADWEPNQSGKGKGKGKAPAKGKAKKQKK